MIVRFIIYLLDKGDAMYESYAISMMSDMSEGVSEIFILDDPEEFSSRYDILEDAEIYKWNECPALSDIKLGGRFYVARRTYKTEDLIEENAHADAFWEKMIAGVQ